MPFNFRTSQVLSEEVPFGLETDVSQPISSETDADWTNSGPDRRKCERQSTQDAALLIPTHHDRTATLFLHAQRVQVRNWCRDGFAFATEAPLDTTRAVANRFGTSEFHLIRQVYQHQHSVRSFSSGWEIEETFESLERLEDCLS
ncbi:hypothetical protein Pan216_52490 [Planctomycetes bacterium Pan216]|uniref:Uncharacterized protein n=1 Tax=Kolteria novifilia TaxID=2527975 RepID=A0A518BBM1_9BACT|nr:hypothetical protein Pan216_52490 [Planctomycetes bacterium Pan216]